MIDLTGTCALEHFTSTIAAELLQNPEIQAMFQDDTMYHLWMWHAVEENEHKAVAFDVYIKYVRTRSESLFYAFNSLDYCNGINLCNAVLFYC